MLYPIKHSSQLEALQASGLPAKNSKAVKTKEGFSYKVQVGWLSIPCQSTYERDLKNIKTIIQYLDKPEIHDGSEVQDESFVGAVTQFKSKTMVRLARLWNFMFGDHHWYNEACARKLVKFYAKEAGGTRNEELTEKVVELYDRLAKIKRGEGTYADGIERGSLIGNKNILTNLTTWLGDLMKQMDPSVANMLKKGAQKAVNGLIEAGEQAAFEKAAKYCGENLVPLTNTPMVQIALLTIMAVTSVLKNRVI